MLLTKLKIATAVLVALAVLGAGTTALTQQLLAEQPAAQPVKEKLASNEQPPAQPVKEIKVYEKEIPLRGDSCDRHCCIVGSLSSRTQCQETRRGDSYEQQ